MLQKTLQKGYCLLLHNMDALKKVYFLGIGGIGMSALARYFNARGVKVYGYDKTRTPLTVELESEGMSVHYEDLPLAIPEDLDLVVWTPAIARSLQEFKILSSGGVTMMKRSEVLGKITAKNKNIAIAGTHGKTTTSSILTHILVESEIKVTAFLGGIPKNYHSNFVDRGHDWIVEEADEYDRSFLQLHPDIAVIGSLDADHLDIYGDRSQMISTYFDFAGQIKWGGLLLMAANIEQLELNRFGQLENLKFLTYGIDTGEVRSNILTIKEGWTTFNYQDDKGNLFNELKLRLPGRHNLQNVTAAIRIGVELGITEFDIRKALESFQGIVRRFEWIFEGKNQVYIDDYAHHPEELKAAIEAARSCYPDRRILGIFQPHLYTRTRDFAQDFAKALDLLDEVILVELYPAREEAIPGISSHTILGLMDLRQKAYVLKKDLIEQLKHRKLDIVITLGAGDLDLMSDQIAKILN
ncbi:MAG: UDP-N-acetylmuramate--L-alanine ligase [Saprospiraceae bacterium]|nr:UDP-N-acetylmuramate--L-alanine ligase [Candidatus Vicinibacter affinis]MBP6173701.1 UDP-N-acetylmuramate--L-alanine ligase [Saprospiraceae bacterium]MBP6523229.1 UDP-N-acetylmuramate--L-alanine ligase [Saprospiraceae bacterium]